MPAETKQQLLEMRDEDERMALLANALGAVGKALERAEEAAERASGNGKVHFPGLPDEVLRSERGGRCRSEARRNRLTTLSGRSSRWR